MIWQFEAEYGVRFQHVLSKDGEYKIGDYYVDGYCEERKWVIEAQGCYTHGCPEPKRYPHLREKYEKTREKIRYLESEGYTVTEVWECKFVFKKDYAKFPNKMTSKQVYNGIKDGSLYGFARVTVRVPDHLIEKYSAFPPIFKVS